MSSSKLYHDPTSASGSIKTHEGASTSLLCRRRLRKTRCLELNNCNALLTMNGENIKSEVRGAERFDPSQLTGRFVTDLAVPDAGLPNRIWR